MDGRSHEFFAVASPGLERVVAAELRGLGFVGARELPGGVPFRGSLVDAYRANVWLRTASRVLLRLGTFDAPGRRELAARLRRIDTTPFISAGAAVHVSASSHQSRLFHTGLVADVVREAFGLAVAGRDEAAPVLHVRLVKDRCTLSIDTSGELLHRRGWRLDGAKAPLRETLAAGLLLLAGYDGSRPFVDPMCGSGTIAVEAALLAAGLPPNARRTMALEAFPSIDRKRVEALREESLATTPRPHAPIHASDVHGGALHAARLNAQRAGVAATVKLERFDVARLAAPAGDGLLVTNPPYGRRIARARHERDDALGALMRALTGSFAGWDRFVVGPGSELRRALRLPVVRAAQLENGGLPVELLQFRRVATAAGVRTSASIPTDAGAGLR